VDSFEVVLARPIADADVVVREALAAQGFGVLTEIDVAATLKAKLGVERPPLVILGACNPQFANRALEIDPTAALVLPCNVVLEAIGGGTRVRIVDPGALIGASDHPELVPLAAEARARLEAVAAALAPEG
jgi:uncharacterized protein (DUF302 family)